MIRRPPRSTQSRSSAASDVYKRQLRIGGRPLRKNLQGRVHRLAHLGAVGECDLALHVTGRRIEHIAEAARCALDLLAVDEMSELFHGANPHVFPARMAARVRLWFSEAGAARQRGAKL